ncbi:baculoviral IAP repeat-containing protein 5.2 isoform X2 [Venturia canescens]|uniref:baculoviral IAP repeat-containing protein 5.2 isoform X2 n=1 Tax=Venturia canescens TaxID=32260 RepID=UPI001C9BF486|nr:baculoviral IAP repeat-containing protein 5.2 isoform X2 [Venturia canescens]
MTTITELFTGLDKTFWTQGRLETYGKWPFKPKDGTCTAERMATAGFFVVEGTDDVDVSVECFICKKQLDGWEPNDDPWQEHSKHQADCPYVLLNKQDEKQWTIDDLFLLIKAYFIKQCAQRMR